MKLIHAGCLYCRYFQGEDTSEFICQAFPDEIIKGYFDHRKPHPNDKGIQFEMNPDKQNMRLYVDETYALIEKDSKRYAEHKRIREEKLRHTYGFPVIDDLNTMLNKLRQMSKQERRELAIRHREQRDNKT